MTHNLKYSTAGRIALLALAGVLLLPLANAQSPGKSGAGSMPGSMAGMDMKAMMKDMNEKMSLMQMTGNQDVDFAMMMRVHHQGAIQMAEAELRDGKEPQMRKMATDIISAQKKEIGQIDKFLAKHGHTADKMSK